MERGVYFDGWFKNNHCYHPSLPLRSMQMIDDLEKYHGTILVWSAMGGGSISLPYLEHEAYGPVDPRMRFYGYMSDAEFIAECVKRGIKPFAIVFEVQGWEFPAVYDEETGEIKRLNVTHGDEPHGWYGLREFSQGVKLFNGKTVKDYYPNGIINSDGELVTDLFEEAAARKLDGSAVHARWVEVRGHKQQCYQTCRNNPVWRDYLKKIMAIQIDAGVPGIQLDEAELPITSIGAGGCFCKDCMKQFREYLLGEREKGALSSDWDDIDLETFHYGDYLRAGNFDYPNGAPFYRDYYEFQMTAVKKYFSELSDFAKAYARETYDREVLISGNFFNLMPVYYPIENKVDVLITEMQHTLFRQPHFYRYCAGFANQKPIIVAENPYGGIVPELLKTLDSGKGYDLFRIFLLEASVYGCNMAVPYGGWMGNTIKDSFYPPRELTAEVQNFLYNNEHFYPKGDVRGAAVLYGFASNYWRETSKGNGGNTMLEDQESLLDCTTSEWENENEERMPFWEIIRTLSGVQANYDIKMLPDDALREDDFALSALKNYPITVVPDCHVLTQNQANVLKDYLAGGGKILVYGRLGENLSLAEELSGNANVTFVSDTGTHQEAMARFLNAFDSLYAPVCPVACDNPSIGIQRFDDSSSTYIHLLNYGYDKTQDRILPIDSLTLSLPDEGKTPTLYTLNGILPDMEITKSAEKLHISLKNVPIYTVVVLS